MKNKENEFVITKKNKELKSVYPTKEEISNLILELEHAQDAIADNDKERLVEIQGIINLEKHCDYTVTCCYKDIILIICVLHDYIKIIDNYRNGPIWDLYRKTFLETAGRFEKQIEYDYEAAMKKCSNKMKNDSDIGEDAVVLMARKKKHKQP